MSANCTPVTLPLMGEGVHEAKVVRWLKRKGEKIQQGEPLIEVATDKVDTEIAAPVGGYVIALRKAEGESVQVEEVMAYIADSPETQAPQDERPLVAPAPKLAKPALGRPQPPKGSHEQGQEPASQLIATASRPQLSPGHFAGPVRSSPVVRRMAKEAGIDLREVQGTGLYGRVTKQDLYTHQEGGGSSRHWPYSHGDFEASFEPFGPFFRLTTQERDGKEYLDGVAVQRKSMSHIRKLTAEHMLRSVRLSPHVTTTFEIDLAKVRHIKNQLGEAFSQEYGGKLTYTAFFLHATAQALNRFPEVNAAIDGDDILYREQINIGCAVAIDTGLIVPVLKDVGAADLFTLAHRLNSLARQAREKKLSPQDVQGGTFSITNPGMWGSLHSQPIINQPQVAILSIGAIIDRPIALDGQVCIHPLCQIGLTFDHRLVDGEGGAKFLGAMKTFLEHYPPPARQASI